MVEQRSTKRGSRANRKRDDDPDTSTNQAATQDDQEEMKETDTIRQGAADDQGVTATRDDELIINTSE